MPNSACVVNDDSFRCVCNPGYQHLYLGNETVCADVDECQSGLHSCDYNAQCINEIGAYSCQCNPGFTGNGRVCETNTPAKASNVLKTPSVSRAIAWRCVDVAKASREMVRRVQLWWIKAVTPTTTVTNLASVPLIHKRIVTIVLVYQVMKEMDTGAEKSQSKMLRKLRYKKRYRDVFLESVGVQKVTPVKRGRRIVFPKGKKQPSVLPETTTDTNGVC
jgi:hypothetical protein